MGRFMSLRVIAWALRAAGLLMGIGVGLALCSALIPGGLGFFRMPSPLEEDHVRTMAEHFRRQGTPPAAS